MDSPLAELDAWWANRFQEEDEFGTDVLRYVQKNEAVRIEFATTGGQDTAYPEHAEWRLDIAEIVESRWHLDWDEPRWFENHPLLIPYTTPGAVISFARPFNDPLRAWGAVARAHRALVGDWFPLERFFHTKWLGDRFALLAGGPRTLLEAYAEALRSVDEEFGYAEIDPPRRERPSPPSVVTWGGSYFVARSFRLERTG